MLDIVSLSPLKLAQALDTTFGRDTWTFWESEVARRDLKAGETDSIDNVLALQVIYTNPDAFDTWELFNNIGLVLNGYLPSFEWLDHLTYWEAAFTCHCMNSLNSSATFGPGVLAYLKAICHHDGVLYFPWIGGDGLESDKNGEYTNEIQALRNNWKSGALQNIKPSSLSEANKIPDTGIIEVQVLKLTTGQEYIKEMLK